MVQVSGSGRAASPSVRISPLRPPIFNCAYGCRRGAPCPSFGVHQQPQRLRGLPPLGINSTSQSKSAYLGFKCATARSAAGHAASGSGVPRGHGGDPKQWSGSWASVTGSYRGSYEEAGGEVADEPPEGSANAELRSRAGKLLALGGAVSLELLLTGSLVWTPLAAAVVALVVLPGARAITAAQAAAREAEAVARAEARVRAEMAARVPVSPPESAVWMGRLMGELWQPFVQPLVLGDNLDHWADKVRRAAPAGLELQLEEMSLGKEAPQMSNFQVLADPLSGRVTAINCDMTFDSSSMRVVVSGSGPLGRFIATMTGISMRGRMRLLPIPDQRMILFSFRGPPTIDPKMTLEGPFLSARDIPPTSLVRSLLAAILQDCLVEPVRAAISLDPDPLVGQPIDTTVHIYIESVQGITGDGSTPASASAGTQMSSASSSASSQTSSLVSPSSQSAQQQSYSTAQRHPDDAKVAEFLESLASEQSIPPSAAAANGSANSGGSGGATAAVVAAASTVAVAASEAVVEGAGAIASLVPGLSAAAGGAAVEGPGRGSRQRMFQVVAINTDSKLQRETTPVPYTASVPGSAVAGKGSVVPVLQMLKLNVGHKETIFKLLVKDVGRSGLVSTVAGVGSGRTATGGLTSASSSSPNSAPASATSVASSLASSSSPTSGSTSAASSTPTSMAAAMVTGLPTPGLLGSVRLHVAAARDGSTLFWAAGLGGEPVAVRWRPSDGPWRVTLPLESPAYGLPPSAPQSTATGAAAATGPQGRTDLPPPPGATAGSSQVGMSPGAAAGSIPGSSSNNNTNGGSGSKRRGSGTYGKPADRSQTSATKSSPTAATALHWSETATSKQSPGPSAGAVNGSAGSTGSAAHTDGDNGSADSSTSRPTKQGAQSMSGHGAGSSSTGLAPAGAPSITLLVSTDPWVYRDAIPPGSAYDSPRPRSLVLQVVEARELAAHDWAGTCDPYVRISYNSRTYRTQTLYNAHTPVWQQTFILPDTRSPASPTSPDQNRLSLSVYDSGVSRDDRLGNAILNLDMASEQLLQDRWIPLQGVESGWLRVRLAAVSDSADSAAVRCVVEALEKLARGTEPLLQHPEDLEGQEEEVKTSIPHSEGQSEHGWQIDKAAGVTAGASRTDSAASNGGAAAESDRMKAGVQTNTVNHHAAASTSTSVSQKGHPDEEALGKEERHVTRNGRGVGSSADPLAPVVPSAPMPGALDMPEVRKSSSSAVDMGPARSRPRPRFRRGLNRDLLRLEVKDVAPVPPDEDLGWVELPVRALLPQPGDSWQGWLPLRRGGGAELMVRISRIEPLPLGQGGLLLPMLVQQQQQQQVMNKAAAGVVASMSPHQGAPVVTVTAAGAAGGGEFGLTGTGSPPQQGLASMEKVLLDSFTDQVRAANRAAGQVGQDLRVRLGQDVIPKIQDWWEGTLQHTVSTFELQVCRQCEGLRAVVP
ncbi:hypothetical protein Vretifemale_20508 [Volvox reticuliferus]|uniref:C2 domain-containing protein n=1 Tax=Volvox reticuliferus TaxID=1737510 RepID=A0A8J4D3N9_9CHLO|nr:hypothetical protein Vretifemale_20508 [Volvox reticuliferus]